MAYNEELAPRIRPSLEEQSGIVERKMFGGRSFMAHGNMAHGNIMGGVMGNEIIVQVGAERYEDVLQQPSAREMDFTGRPMRAFVVARVDGISSDDDLANWAERWLEFALSMPPK